MEHFSVQEKKLEDLLPENMMKTRVPQVEVKREIKPAPSRYRNEIAKYIIFRSDDCIRCGKCAEVCPNNVHVLKPGYKYFAIPRSDKCVGISCEKTDHFCVALCPRGIATTDPGLIKQMTVEWGTQRIINLYNAWRKELVGILKRLGMKSVTELCGRTDLLTHLDFE